MTVDIVKGVIQLNGRALILAIEQHVEVLLSSMPDLLVLNQKLICFVLDAFDLVDIPGLHLLDLGHLIDVRLHV